MPPFLLFLPFTSRETTEKSWRGEVKRHPRTSLGKATAGAGGSRPSLRGKPAGAQSPKGLLVTSCSSRSGLRTEKPRLTLNKSPEGGNVRPRAPRRALRAPMPAHCTAPPPPSLAELKVRATGKYVLPGGRGRDDSLRQAQVGHVSVLGPKA